MTNQTAHVMQLIEQYFPNEIFSCAQLTKTAGEPVFPATLTSLVARNKLEKVYSSPIRYRIVHDAKDITTIDFMPFEFLENGAKICCADSTTQLFALQEKSVDCVITDPPYFIDSFGDTWDKEDAESREEKAKAVHSLPTTMKFDIQQGIDLQNFMSQISTQIYNILKPGGFFICFSSPRLYHRMTIAIENAGFEIRDMLVWEREGHAKAFSQDYITQQMNISQEEKEKVAKIIGGRKTPQLKPNFEAIVLAQKPREGTYVENYIKYNIGLVDVSQSLDGKFPSTILTVPRDKENSNFHFTVKPVALMSHLIKLFSPPNAIILDPFMGSGTTGVAALQTGRNFIGIEKNSTYYELSKTRIISEAHSP